MRNIYNVEEIYTDVDYEISGHIELEPKTIPQNIDAFINNFELELTEVLDIHIRDSDLNLRENDIDFVLNFDTHERVVEIQNIILEDIFQNILQRKMSFGSIVNIILEEEIIGIVTMKFQSNPALYESQDAWIQLMFENLYTVEILRNKNKNIFCF